MAKTCETCGKLITERNIEDGDQYCLDMNNINTIPSPEDNPDFECPDWVPADVTKNNAKKRRSSEVSKFSLGQKVSFTKHLKRTSYEKNFEVSKEFAEICGLKLIEDKSYIGGFWIPKCPWYGHLMSKETEGIICGKRNIGVAVYKSFGYDEWDLGIEKYKQVYLVANKLSGFYYVLPEWIKVCE